MTEKKNEPILGEDFQAAQDALEKAIHDRDAATLETALKSRSYAIRTRAAEALGKVGGKQSIRPLCDALENRWALLGGTEVELYQRQLVTAVVGALARLTGEDFGPINPDSDDDVRRVLEKARRQLEPPK